MSDVIHYVILALGIPGNILSAIVWLRRHVVSKNSSAVYLAALAIDDLAYLFFDLSIYIFHCFSATCIYLLYLVNGAAMIESLLVLSFSIEHLIAILHPLQVHSLRVKLKIADGAQIVDRPTEIIIGIIVGVVIIYSI